MKLLNVLLSAGVITTVVSCGSSKGVYMETSSPEEIGLNLVKVTDESNNSVLAGGLFKASSYYINNYVNGSYAYGVSRKFGVAWPSMRVLDVSPDGKSLAYCTRMNGQDNVMVRSTGTQGVATQRTFRNVHSFSWGSDGNIYFSDNNGRNYYICSVNAEKGSMMNQLTNGIVTDTNPMLSSDGNMLFFQRMSSGGPSIWALNRKDGTLTSCARGFMPCLIKDEPNAFYCVRNSTSGRSEIWYVDFVNGKESLILSDENRSFTHPRLSPDGKWIVCVGNSVSSISKKSNLDIFVVRTDGTRLTQLTYHPADDMSPVFSADGRSIFFISSRANERQSYNVWRMNFNPDM